MTSTQLSTPDEQYDRLSKLVDERLAAALVFDRVINLPESIDHDAFCVFTRLDAWVQKQKEPGLETRRVTLFCDGSGGDSDAGLAIASLVVANPVYDGIIAGVAYSAHVTVFAACSRRYVYPYASIGVHRGYYGWAEGHTMTTDELEVRYKAVERTNELTAGFLARASNVSVETWRDLMVDSTASRVLSADWMMDYEMAKPISKRRDADRLAILKHKNFDGDVFSRHGTS